MLAYFSSFPYYYYYYYYYAAFNAPCVGHKDGKSQAQMNRRHVNVIVKQMSTEAVISSIINLHSAKQKMFHTIPPTTVYHFTA